MASDFLKSIRELQAELNSLGKDLKEYRDAYNDFAKNSGKIGTKIKNRIGEELTDAVDKIYRKSISDFYDDYNPQYYDRTEQIYNMYDIQRENGSGDLTILEGPLEAPHKFAQISSFSYPDPTTQHRVDKRNTSYIFNQAWMKGFHGGATPTNKKDRFGRSFPKGNQVAYRWPTMSMEYIDDRGRERHIPRFSLWSKRKDIKSEPIENFKHEQIKKFNDGENNYSGTTVDEVLINIVNQEFEKYSIIFE